MNKTIRVLGTEYSIETDDEGLKKIGADGLCKEYDKQILIRTVGVMLCDDDSTDTKKRRYKEVLRHEIIHAFFIEAGLLEYSSDERLVDWIATQFPKMLQVFNEVDCV